MILSPLAAEDRPASSVVLEELIVELLPRIDLPTLLIEVDKWVNFTNAFTHAGGSSSRNPDLLPTIYDVLAAAECSSGAYATLEMPAYWRRAATSA